MEQIEALLPEAFKSIVHSMTDEELGGLEEIRCRTGCPLELIVAGRIWKPAGVRMPVFHADEARDMLHKIGRYSLYALEEELRRGFVTVGGGHRIGLAGRVITEGGHVLRLRDVTFFNIRLAREKIGSARFLIPFLYKEGTWLRTLIIGSPQTGKTTLLRDLARIIGEGCPERGISAFKTGIVDERSEIAGCVNGIPQNRIGDRADVLDGCPKAEGLMMMIRSMSPDVLVVDEIGRKEDSDALYEALNAGVGVIGTAHGSGLEQLKKRPTLRPLIESRLFDRYVLLRRIGRGGKTGCRSSICDGTGKLMTVSEALWR